MELVRRKFPCRVCLIPVPDCRPPSSSGRATWNVPL